MQMRELCGEFIPLPSFPSSLLCDALVEYLWWWLFVVLIISYETLSCNRVA